MTCTKVIFNPLRLDPQPTPIRPFEVVFEAECPAGDPRLVSEHMKTRTKSEYALLGRMYDKQFVKRLDIGATPSFFGTQQSYLNMLTARGLTELIANQRNRYQLTMLGKRVYELNFWLLQYKRQPLQHRIIERGLNHKVEELKGDWVNPKPNTEPNALPKSHPIHANVKKHTSPNLDTALPPGIYPRLKD